MLAIKYRRIILVVSVVVCATITWWASKAWLEGPSLFTNWSDILWPSLAVVLMASVTGIAWILITHRVDRWAAILASWATFTIFWRPDIWYVSALPLFIYFWYEASRSIRDEVHNRRRFAIRATLGRGVKFILLGAFLMVSLGFYLEPASRNTDISDISRSIQSQIDDAYDTAFVQDQLSQLPPGAQAGVKRDIATKVNTFIHKWLGPVAGYIPPILAFALFITLWSVVFLYRWAAIFLGMGIWKILTTTKVVKVVEEEVQGQTVQFE